MSFGCQKARMFPAPGLCHKPGPPHPAAICTMCMFRAHIIWVPPAKPMSTFLSVLNNEHTSLIKIQMKQFYGKLMSKVHCFKNNQIIITSHIMKFSACLSINKFLTDNGHISTGHSLIPRNNNPRF